MGKAIRQILDLQPHLPRGSAEHPIFDACSRRVGGTVCKSKTLSSMHLGARRQCLARRAAAYIGGGLERKVADRSRLPYNRQQTADMEQLEPVERRSCLVLAELLSVSRFISVLYDSDC